MSDCLGQIAFFLIEKKREKNKMKEEPQKRRKRRKRETRERLKETKAVYQTTRGGEPLTPYAW